MVGSPIAIVSKFKEVVLRSLSTKIFSSQIQFVGNSPNNSAEHASFYLVSSSEIAISEKGLVSSSVYVTTYFHAGYHNKLLVNFKIG